MAQKTIQAAIDKYGAIYCKEDLEALKDAVEECYKDTPETSPEIDKCLVADRAISDIAMRKNLNYEKTHDPLSSDPDAVNPYYSNKISNSKEKYYLSAPRFKKDPVLGKLDSIDVYSYLPDFFTLPELFTKRCPDRSIELR